MNHSRTLPTSLVLAAVLLLPAAVSAQRMDRTFPADSETVLEIRNLHGKVILHGWDKLQVRIVGTPRTQAVETHVEHQANRIHVHTHLLQSTAPARDHMADYEVWAPANIQATIVLQTGALEVENFSEEINIQTVAATVLLRHLSGRTYVKTLNGSIRAERCTGRIDAETISGTLRFVDSTLRYLKAGTTSGDIYYVGNLKFGGTYEFSNNEGLIELRLPDKSSFELTASALRGQVENEFHLKTRQHGRVPARGGQRSLLGTSESGSAMVRATSFSGTIRIRKQ